MLVFGYIGIVERRVRLKVPAEQAEDVAHDALVRAIGAAFAGTSVGELRGWLNTITDRTIADFFRKRERTVQAGPLPAGGAGDENARGAEPVAPGGEIERLELELVVDRVLATFNATHRLVIDRYVFDGLSAAGAAESVREQSGEAMSEANVHKIAQRFRDALREELGGAGPGVRP